MLKKNEWWWPVAMALAALVFMLLMGCTNAINNIALPTKGVIISKWVDTKDTIIKVRFNYGPNSYDYVDFKGSDTCKIGQIVNLR